MSEKNKNAQANPYDLSAIRRSASVGTLKLSSPTRQPYALTSSPRLIKSTVLLRPKKSD
jgi:hypothetical protein